MDTINDQFFSCLCRTCMHELAEVSLFDANSKQNQNWQSIFDTFNGCGGLQIAEVLSNSIPQLEVLLSDALPKRICSECLEQLLNVYQFQQMCRQSDVEIRKLIPQGQTELKKSTRDASPVKDDVIANIVLKQQALMAGTPRTIEFASVDISPKTPQIPAADPLQNIEVVMKDCTDDDSKNVKNEPCDEHNIEYNDNETPLSMLSVKKESLSKLQHNCHLCNESFQKPRYLKIHLNKHTKKNQEMPVQHKKKLESYRFHCDICNRLFHKPESLHNHRLTHDVGEDNQLNDNVCEICGKTCSSKRALASHKKNYHSAENSQKLSKQYPCEFCNKSYNRCDSLRVHLRTHTGERPYLCPECGKAFSQAGNLKQHRLRHGGEKSFECPYCPAKFTCPNDVCKHKAVHKGIKKHICDICGASFSKSDDLKRHKMLHSGEKPYKCDYCEMRFNRMEYQRCHMRTHTGEKPYKCKYCERAFAQSNDHVKHLRRHLGANVYRCELCPLSFRLASEMRLHFVLHKNEDGKTRERNMKALKDEEAKLAQLYSDGLQPTVTTKTTA